MLLRIGAVKENRHTGYRDEMSMDGQLTSLITVEGLKDIVEWIENRSYIDGSVYIKVMLQSQANGGCKGYIKPYKNRTALKQIVDDINRSVQDRYGNIIY